MTLPNQLDVLEASGLVRLVQMQPELEYLFRHALVQDVAYASILKSDRQRLHQVVGATLEKLYIDKGNSAAVSTPPLELAPVLAQHFAAAGNYDKALHYYVEAGNAAART